MNMLVIILILAAIVALGLILTRKKVEHNESDVHVGPGNHSLDNGEEPRPDDEEHADEVIEKE